MLYNLANDGGDNYYSLPLESVHGSSIPVWYEHKDKDFVTHIGFSYLYGDNTNHIRHIHSLFKPSTEELEYLKTKVNFTKLTFKYKQPMHLLVNLVKDFKTGDSSSDYLPFQGTVTVEGIYVVLPAKGSLYP